MAEFFINLRTAIHNLQPLEKICILGVLCIFLVFSINGIIKAHYNAKKLVLKISPIIITALLLGVILFICFA